MNVIGKFDAEEFIEYLKKLSAPEFSIRRVDGSMDLSTRFNTIRANYAAYQRRVDAGLGDWARADPYKFGDWPTIFTPIEYAAWGEIRDAGISLYPQFPVGRFFVDFGNPVKRVALECDGKAFHDSAKDAERDRILLDMGWTVYRAPGWLCMKEMRIPDEMIEREGEVSDEYRNKFATQTMRGLIQRIARNHFPERAQHQE